MTIVTLRDEKRGRRGVTKSEENDMLVIIRTDATRRDRKEIILSYVRIEWKHFAPVAGCQTWSSCCAVPNRWYDAIVLRFGNKTKSTSQGWTVFSVSFWVYLNNYNRSTQKEKPYLAFTLDTLLFAHWRDDWMPFIAVCVYSHRTFTTTIFQLVFGWADCILSFCFHVTKLVCWWVAARIVFWLEKYRPVRRYIFHPRVFKRFYLRTHFTARLFIWSIGHFFTACQWWTMSSETIDFKG